MDFDRKKFFQDILFSFLPPFFISLSGLVIMVFITKHIGSIGYGIWAQVKVTLSFGLGFLCLNFGGSLGRFLAGEKSKEYVSKVFSSVLFSVSILTVLAGVVFYLLRDDLSDFLFGNEKLGLIVLFLGILFVFQGLNRLNRGLLKARRYIKFWSIIESIGSVLLLIFIALSAVFTENIVIVIGSFVFLEILFFLAFFIFILKNEVKLVKPDFHSLVPLLKFGIPLLIVVMGYWIVQTSDRYIIKYFMDISWVGIYSVSYSFSFLISFLWGSFNTVLLADFSALYDKKEKRELEVRFSRVLKYGLAGSIPIIVGIFILSEPLIKIFSSQEFIAAAPALVIISISMLFFGLLMHFANFLNILKKTKILSLIWIMMAILNIGLNFLFIPKIGIIGAAYSTLISFLVGAVIVIVYSSQYFNIVFKKEWLIKIAIAITIMGGVISLISVHSFLTLTMTILTGVLFYGGTMFLLKFQDRSELLLMREVFPVNNFLKKNDKNNY
ncbi:flippase [Patescibacteria group bacterium]